VLTASLRLLENAVSTTQGRVESRWADLLEAVHTVIALPFDGKVERVLLEVTRFEGPLNLSEASDLPHSMSPENMLKSLAIQSLGKRTGLTHLKDLKRVEATTTSPVLRSIVRATIRHAQPDKDSQSDLQTVADIDSEPAFREPVWDSKWTSGRAMQRSPRALVTKTVSVVGGLTAVSDRLPKKRLNRKPVPAG